MHLVRLRNYMNSDEGWGPVEGCRVRAHLEQAISQAPLETTIVVSMEGITRTDSVFPREAVIELAVRQRCQRGICLTDLHDQVLLENWENAALRCQQPLFLWGTNICEPYLLGPQPSVGLRDVLRYVLSVGSTRTSEAASTLQMTLQNASNKLKGLWETGYILREEQCAQSGGKEHLYFKIAGAAAAAVPYAGLSLESRVACWETIPAKEMKMATRVRLPELAVGDKVPNSFTSSLRGAAQMAYEEGVSLKYRRHFWYVTKIDATSQDDIVQHVCTSYQDARDKYCAAVEERIKEQIGKTEDYRPTVAQQDTTHYIW